METLFLQRVASMGFYHHFIIEIDTIFSFPNNGRKVDESFMSIWHPVDERHIGMRIEDLLNLWEYYLIIPQRTYD